MMPQRSTAPNDGRELGESMDELIHLFETFLDIEASLIRKDDMRWWLHNLDHALLDCETGIVQTDERREPTAGAQGTKGGQGDGMGM